MQTVSDLAYPLCIEVVSLFCENCCYVHYSVCVLGQFTRYSFSVARVKAVYSQWI